MTKVAELADGTRLEFPDETADEVIDRVVKSQLSGAEPAPSQPSPMSWADRHFLRMHKWRTNPAEMMAGNVEKTLQAGTGMLAAPVSGLAGIATGLLPGGNTAAEGVEKTAKFLTYDPSTEAGQTPGIIAESLAWAEDKVDRFAEATGDSDDVLGATMVKTAILGLPALFGLKRAVTPKAKGAAQPKPGDALDLGSEDVISAADKIVTQTFKKFKGLAKDDPIDMQFTFDAVQEAYGELIKQGKQGSSLGRELKRIMIANEGEVVASASLLDDIFGNMTKTLKNPKATGQSQAKQVIQGIIDDMDAHGKNYGMNFAAELDSARAFAALYKNRGDLGRVIGQHGEKLRQYKATDPAGYREIVVDWAGKRLESFVRTNTSGGRQFDTGKFSEWVTKNEAHLNQLVGPETVQVWKAFPKWEGRANLLRGLGQGVLTAKTGGLSRVFNKTIDIQFADSMARMLTDPSSPLFQALSAAPKKPVFPIPQQLLQSELVNAQEQR